MSSLAPSETRQRSLLVAVAVASMLLPVLLALTALPTAMSDTRELIAWGRAWPLITPKHPPMMTWVGAVVDKTLGPSAAAAILVNQILLGTGVLYLYATLKLLIEGGAAALIAFLFATSVYVVGAPLSYALNADILQITSWTAIVYHFLAAARGNRINHWVALGAWSAAAILTKYNVGVLFLGMLIATFFVREFRHLLANPRLYFAAMLGLVLIAPHAISLWKHPQAMKFAGDQLRQAPGLGTLDSLAGLFFGYIVFLAPSWIFFVIGFFRRDLTFETPATAEHLSWPQGLKFLVVLNIASVGVLILLILLGLHYLYRFDAPYLALALLAGGPLVAWNRDRFNLVTKRIVVSAGTINLALFVGAEAMYLLVASHDRMQEPTVATATAILADWNSRYKCGPGYFIGEAPSVYGVGIVASPKVIALLTEMVPETAWFDRHALDDSGAVILYRGPVGVDEVKAVVPNAQITDEKALTLPLLWTLTGKTISYHYRFIPPQHCPLTPR